MPDDGDVYIGPSGRAYHTKMACATTSKYPFMQVQTITLEDAIERGLNPCTNCDPPVPGDA